jgi:glutamyl-tRNA synthetase
MKLRFAPSPTGLLHVGNLRTALANYLFARRHGGHFALRLDDTDAARSRPEFAEAIEHDLRWLGLAWDSVFRQSDRMARYAAAAERLKASGRLYPCFESEDELRSKREQRLRLGKPPLYDRAMLKLTAAQRAAAEAGGKRPYWRFLLSGRTIAWDDLVLGERQVKLTAMSDPVMVRADGTPLYGFTSVVDDLEEGTTHVLRGEDHVSNTGLQVDLWEALSVDPDRIVRFGHLPLLLDGEGGKLSKRLESVSVRSLRGDGMLPESVVGMLARLGTPDPPEALPLAVLAAEFDPRRFSHGPARFDAAQLLAANARALHALPFEAVRDRLPEGAGEAFWLAVRGNLELLTEARLWWEVVAGDIVAPLLEEDAAFLRQALDVLPEDSEAAPWGEATWGAWTGALKAASGRRGRALFHPLRLALTGEERGPELAALLPLMGRTRVAGRLRAAA